MRAVRALLAIACATLGCGDPRLVLAPPAAPARTQVIGPPDGEGATVVSLDDPAAALFGPLDLPVLHALLYAPAPAALGLEPGPLDPGLTGLRLPPPDEVRAWRSGVWEALGTTPLTELRTALEIPACSALGGCYVAGDHCSFDCPGLGEPAPPAPPIPPAAPAFRCNSGWRNTSVATATACEPSLTDADCGAAQLVFPGAEACVDLDRPEEWPAVEASGRRVLYVDDRAAPGGDGLSPERALFALDRVFPLADGRPMHVVVANGEFVLSGALAPGSVLEGASPDRVQLAFGRAQVRGVSIRRVEVVLPELAATTSVTFEHVRARGSLRILSGGFVRFVRSTLAEADEAASIKGRAEVFESRWETPDVTVDGSLDLRRSRLILEGRAQGLAGAELSLADSVVEGGRIEATGDGAHLTLVRSEVRGAQARCGSCALVRVADQARAELSMVVLRDGGPGLDALHGYRARSLVVEDAVMESGADGVRLREVERVEATRVALALRGEAGERVAVWSSSSAVTLRDLRLTLVDEATGLHHESARTDPWVARLQISGGRLGVEVGGRTARITSIEDLDLRARQGVRSGPRWALRLERGRLVTAGPALDIEGPATLIDVELRAEGDRPASLARLCRAAPTLERVALSGGASGVPLLDVAFDDGPLVTRDVTLAGGGLALQAGAVTADVERLSIRQAEAAVRLGPMGLLDLKRADSCEDGWWTAARAPDAVFSPLGSIALTIADAGRCFDASPADLAKLPLTALRATGAKDCARPSSE